MLASAVLEIEHSESAATRRETTANNTFQPRDLPLVCREVLGESVVERTLKSLQTAGIRSILVVAPDSLSPYVSDLSRKYRDLQILHQAGWLAAGALGEIQNCGEQVLIIRLGAYVEVDVPDLLRFHRDRREPVVRARDHQGPLDVWVMKAAPNGTVRAAWRVAEDNGNVLPYLVSGYSNRLRNWHDFRDLVKDMLSMRCTAQPCGREVRPGIWMEDGAYLHPQARVVAPAYFGHGSSTRVGALITRFSSVEHHCEVGPGTVVDDSAILPYTRIGGQLHVTRAVVDENHFVCLRRDVRVAVGDPKLLCSTAPRRRHWVLEGPGKVHPEQSMPEITGLKQALSLGAAVPRVLGFLKDEL